MNGLEADNYELRLNIILKKSKERASVKVAAKKSIKTPVSIVSN